MSQDQTTPVVSPLHVYDSTTIRLYNQPSLPIPRCTRKVLFAFQLWRPQWTRTVIPSSTRRTEPSLPLRSTSASSESSVLRADLTPPAASQSSPPPSSIGSGGLKFGSLNVHSLRNKFMDVYNMIAQHFLDILVVTESWLSTSAYVAIRRSTPPGYLTLDAPRLVQDSQDPLSQNYGGIVVYYREHLRTKIIQLPGLIKITIFLIKIKKSDFFDLNRIFLI